MIMIYSRSSISVLTLMVLMTTIWSYHYTFRSSSVIGPTRYLKTIQLSMSVPTSSPIKISRSDMYHDALKERIKKWYLLNHKTRAEVYISDAAVKTSIYKETWNSILISLRVLQLDLEQQSYTSIHIFPNYLINSTSTNTATSSTKEAVLSSLNGYAQSIEANLNHSSPIFQSNFNRKLHFHMVDIPEDDIQNLLLLSVKTVRESIDIANFEDLDDYTPSINDTIITNDIESFPFASVYDFISEINRPPDPFTMSELAYKFSIKDFKYDLNKMKKKKNPQETVDGINCKLTRLLRWKNILMASEPLIPDPDVNLGTWSEKVRQKYMSLKAAVKQNPKQAMDTQYDKKTTFIRIIDLWMDRLLRNFKYIYQSTKLKQEDFMLPILTSVWRNDVVNITKLFGQSLFLDLEGKAIVPGSPKDLFDDRRMLLWTSSYPVDIVMYEMIAWMTYISNAKKRSSSDYNSRNDVYNAILQHTYSRGLVAERCMTDVCDGVDRWVRKYLSNDNHTGATAPSDGIVLNAQALVLSLSNKKHSNAGSTESSHSDDFLSTLSSINTLARAKSDTERLSVKQSFRQSHVAGNELNEWLTTIVRNNDKLEEMNRLSQMKAKGEKWSTIIDTVINDLYRSYTENINDSSVDTVASVAEIEENLVLWNTKYRKVLEEGELLQSLMPWSCVEDETFNPETLEKEINSKLNLIQETVHVDFLPITSSDDGKSSSSCLIVLPRLFRGFTSDSEQIEMSAFLEFCKVVTTNIMRQYACDSDTSMYQISMIPLHPRMVNQKGYPDYERMAPHPSLLFTINKK